jgi:prepilin-type N-terminal cleavage/methylation domain-containing protein
MNGSCRRGFTLVELLVVTGLMAGLLGLMLSVGRPSGRSQVNQLLQALSSAVISTQTRALGNDAGAAMFLDPGTNGMPAVACNVALSTDAPPFAVGAVTGTGATGMPPASLVVISTNVALAAPQNGSAANLQQGYRIRFSGTSPVTPASPWFRFSCPGGDPASCTVSFRSDANQTSDNTVWPRSAAGTFLRYEVAQFPQRGVPLTEPTKLAAIDLRYSGIGDDGLGSYASLHNKGPIVICFDRDGRLDSIMQYGTGSLPTVDPLTPTSPLYLLVATVADIQANQSLQATTSRWLAIAPTTGRVSIAANVAVAGTTAADIRDARANARVGITQGVGK